MSPRPLVLLCGLTLADYALWNWSLNGNRTVLALIAGLSLPPLALACVWLLIVNAARLIARGTRSPAMRTASRPAARRRAAEAGARAASAQELDEAGAPTRSSNKIAA